MRDVVIAMVADLSRDHGKAYAREAAFREELHRRTGYRCGERSIGRLLGVLHGEGVIKHERILPGRRDVRGVIRTQGGQHNWPAPTKREQRAARRREREDARQARHASERAKREAARIEPGPVPGSPLTALPLALQAYVLPPGFLESPHETGEQLAARRHEVERQLRAALERADLWLDDLPADDEPPDK